MKNSGDLSEFLHFLIGVLCPVVFFEGYRLGSVWCCSHRGRYSSK